MGSSQSYEKGLDRLVRNIYIKNYKINELYKSYLI